MQSARAQFTNTIRRERVNNTHTQTDRHSKLDCLSDKLSSSSSSTVTWINSLTAGHNTTVYLTSLISYTFFIVNYDAQRSNETLKCLTELSINCGTSSTPCNSNMLQSQNMQQRRDKHSCIDISSTQTAIQHTHTHTHRLRSACLSCLSQ